MKKSSVVVGSLLWLGNSNLLLAQEKRLSLNALLDLKPEVELASNIIRDAEKQPVSVTVINEEQIRLSGARTVSDLMTLYVPGYYRVNDQDDDIAGFRGFAPDNNVKVLFLVDGIVLNTEWFWGPPDSVLNSIALNYIERVEVIRGPGSATLGAGALLGVVNIVTKGRKTVEGDVSESVVTGFGGADNFQASSWQFLQKTKDTKAFAYFYAGQYDGQDLRNEGWAKSKGWEGTGDATSIHSSDLRLFKTDNRTFIGRVESGNVTIESVNTNQKRDLFNFYRDRSVVEQALNAFGLKYTHKISDNATIDASLKYALDDYALYSTGGTTLGGTREIRTGGKVMYVGRKVVENLDLVVGAESVDYKSGRENRYGNNFLVNKVGTSLLNNPNDNAKWVYASTTDVHSLFLETVYAVSKDFDIFAAVRYDKHPGWGSQITPRVGFHWISSPEFRLRMTYQSGFRGAPGVAYSGGYQGDGYLRVDNLSKIAEATNGAFENVPDIKPETMNNLELQYNFKFMEAFELEHILYYNVLTNLIDVGVVYYNMATDGPVPSPIGNDVAGDWNGYWFYKNNEGEIKSAGSEATLSYTKEALRASLNYSVTKVLSSPEGDSMYLTQGDDKNFKAYPEHIIRLNGIYKISPQVSSGLTYVRELIWYSPEQKKLEGNDLVNLSTDYLPTPSLTLGLSVRNLLDGRKLSPMNSNAGGRDNSPGSPTLEHRTYLGSLAYKF
jgi:outer membrane receptor for ferrienterochelin and colicin